MSSQQQQGVRLAVEEQQSAATTTNITECSIDTSPNPGNPVQPPQQQTTNQPAHLQDQFDPSAVYVIPAGDDNHSSDDEGALIETTSIGRMDRDPASQEDEDTSETSSFTSDLSSDSDSDPLNLFSNTDMINLVATLLDVADDGGDGEMGHGDPGMFRTENEISDDFVSIPLVQNLQLPPQDYIDQLDPSQPLIAGLEPLGTIMNLFQHRVILKPWGAKSSIFTDSSDDSSDDDSDNDFDRQNLRFGVANKPKVQKPKSSAAGKVATTNALARLTTLKLQTPIFNRRGEAVGRLSDTIGHVQFPFFVVSFHNEVLEKKPEEETATTSTTTATTTDAPQPAEATNTPLQDSTPIPSDTAQNSNLNNNNKNANNKNNNNKPNNGKGRQGQNNGGKPPKKERHVIYHPIPQLENGQVLYFLPSMAHSVATQTLVGKATDASNRFDEEVGGSDCDYSDDEQERNAKKRQRVQKERERFGQNGRFDQQNSRNNNMNNNYSNNNNNRNNNTYNKNEFDFDQNFDNGQNRGGRNKMFNNKGNNGNNYNNHGKPTYNKGPIDLSQPLDLSSRGPPAPPPGGGFLPPPPPQYSGYNHPNAYQSNNSQPPPQEQQFLPPPPPSQYGGVMMMPQQHQSAPNSYVPAQPSNPYSAPPQAPLNPYSSPPQAPSNPYSTQSAQPSDLHHQHPQQQHQQPHHNQQNQQQQNMAMYQQYQMLSSNGVPLTPQQRQHYAQLGAMFGQNVNRQ